MAALPGWSVQPGLHQGGVEGRAGIVGAAAFGPVPERGVRVGARLIDLVLEGVVAFALIVTFGDGHRFWGNLALAWLVVTVYETVLVATAGATLGKLAVGLRVVELDRVGTPGWPAAARRAASTGGLAAVPVVGWGIWLTSTFTDALTRNIADRTAETMVVRKDAEQPIRSKDLAGFADFVRPPRWSPFGRVGDLDVRVRARVRRLVDAPWLAVLLGLIALALNAPFATRSIAIVAVVVWIVAFTIDETIRVARTGQTYGHRMAGLVIHCPATGGPPSRGRSFVRAFVLALEAYTVIGWLPLAVSAILVRTSASGRSLHDLVAGTWVVADPRLDPEAQRRRAMLMRMGEFV